MQDPFLDTDRELYVTRLFERMIDGGPNLIGWDYFSALCIP